MLQVNLRDQLLPVKAGTEWVVCPRRYWIEALDAKIETRAGKFEGCMRVAYLIAEGDGGGTMRPAWDS